MVYQYDHFPGDIFHGALHPFPTWTDVLEVGSSAVLGSPFTVMLRSTSLLSRVEPVLSFILGAAQPTDVLRGSPQIFLTGSPEILPVRKGLTAYLTQCGKVQNFRLEIIFSQILKFLIFFWLQRLALKSLMKLNRLPSSYLWKFLGSSFILVFQCLLMTSSGVGLLHPFSWTLGDSFSSTNAGPVSLGKLSKTQDWYLFGTFLCPPSLLTLFLISERSVI